MAVTRTIKRWMPVFNRAGEFKGIGILGVIEGEEVYLDEHGNEKGIEDEIWYRVEADDPSIPQSFIDDLEAMHAKIVTAMDNRFPFEPPA